MIKWNNVTWYSKLLALVVFVGVFVVAFCLGTRYEEVVQMQNGPLVTHYNPPIR